MSNNNLLLFPGFLEQAAVLPKDTKAKLFKCLHYLCNDPRHPSLHTKKVKGTSSNVFECRVDRCIRLIFDRVGSSLRCWYVGEHNSTLKLASGAGMSVDDIELIEESVSIEAINNYLETNIINDDFLELPLNKLQNELSSIPNI